jgi:hypothetical protein
MLQLRRGPRSANTRGVTSDSSVTRVGEVPPAGALRLRDGGSPLPWPTPESPSSGPSAEQTSRGPQAAVDRCRDPSRSACWFGWRDDGDGMGQAAPPVCAGACSLPLESRGPQTMCTKNKVEQNQRYLLRMLQLSPDPSGTREPAPLESHQAHGRCLRQDPRLWDEPGCHPWARGAPQPLLTSLPPRESPHWGLLPGLGLVLSKSCPELGPARWRPPLYPPSCWSQQSRVTQGRGVSPRGVGPREAGPRVSGRPCGAGLGAVPTRARLLGAGVFVGGLEAGDFGVEVGQHGPDGGDPRAQLSGCQACRVLRQLVNCADDPGDRPTLDRTHARILAGAGDRTRRDHVNLPWTLRRGCVGSAAVGGRASKARRGPTRQAY